MVTLDIINMTTIITNTTTPRYDKDFFLIVYGLSYVLPRHPNAFNTTINNSAIAIDMTSPMDIIRFALRQPTILRKRQLYSRQKLRNKNFKRDT